MKKMWSYKSYKRRKAYQPSKPQEFPEDENLRLLEKNGKFHICKIYKKTDIELGILRLMGSKTFPMEKIVFHNDKIYFILPEYDYYNVPRSREIVLCLLNTITLLHCNGFWFKDCNSISSLLALDNKVIFIEYSKIFKSTDKKTELISMLEELAEAVKMNESKYLYLFLITHIKEYKQNPSINIIKKIYKTLMLD